LAASLQARVSILVALALQGLWIFLHSPVFIIISTNQKPKKKSLGFATIFMQVNNNAVS
jgi:hypothetical protein